jgi:glucokinase-like ROK family protein
VTDGAVSPEAARAGLETLRRGDHRLVRGVNRALVMELLRDSPRSRAELAEQTGLAKATIGKLVDGLQDEGLIRDAGTMAQGPGRPATLLEIDPGAGYVIGAELGVDFIRVLLTDFLGRRLHDAQADVVAVHGPTLAIRTLERLVRDVMEEAGVTEASVLGLGLSVCGLVDENAGTIVYSPNHGWTDVPVRQDLGRHHRFPVFIENDAKISALGEELFGVARGVEDFVLVTGSAGIGVGIVSAGRLIHGANGWAGEFGHMTIVPDGPPCRCGNRGCWETLASERALLARLDLHRHPPDRLATHDGLPTSWSRVRHVAEAAAAGDSQAAAAIRETGRYLGIGVASVINALNPSLVVIGGGLSLVADLLLPEVEAIVEERALRASREACRIQSAAHGIDTCAMGGVALAVTELYTPSHLRIARPT